jgi:membrane protease subunit (stomatin/prohibitin family)
MQPVVLVLSSGIAPVSGFGDFACAVTDPARLAGAAGGAQGQDAIDAVAPRLKSALALAFGDALAELGAGKADVAAIAADSAAIAAAMQARVEPRFGELGLTLRAVTIGAIKQAG